MEPADNLELPAAEGTHVVIDLYLDEGVERLEFDLVPDTAADFPRGFLGIGTPLARAVLGCRVGALVPYRLGDARQVQIVAVTLAQSAPPEDVQARREETVRKAIAQSDRTNAMIFASSFSGKWGDYDPTGFVEEI